MKYVFFLFFAALIYACGPATEQSEETDSEDSTTMEESRYSASDSFEAADPANMEIIRNWNNALAAGDIDQAFTYVADSIEVVMADGTRYNTTRDSMRVVVEEFLDAVSDISIQYLAGASVKSTDMNGTWVPSYTYETMTTDEGEESMIIHEAYHLVNGKIRNVYQYSQVPSEIDAFGEPQDGEYLYSGSFEMMDNTNVDIVNGFFDALESEDWDAIGSYFADSVTIIFPDGSFANTVRDSVIVMAEQWLENASVKFNYTAAFALRSTVQNEEWVPIWFEEELTTPEGTQRSALHETYRLENGKIRFMRQLKQDVADD